MGPPESWLPSIYDDGSCVALASAATGEKSMPIGVSENFEIVCVEILPMDWQLDYIGCLEIDQPTRCALIAASSYGSRPNWSRKLR